MLGFCDAIVSAEMSMLVSRRTRMSDAWRRHLYVDLRRALEWSEGQRGD